MRTECNRLAPDGAHHCGLWPGHDGPHRNGGAAGPWLDTNTGPSWTTDAVAPVVIGGRVVASIDRDTLDSKGDGTPHPKDDPDHRHNYLKRVADERRAYDMSVGADHSKVHIAAAFGYASVSEMEEAIKANKANMANKRKAA